LQPSLLQAEQAQLPQPLLIGEMFQSPHHPCSPQQGLISLVAFAAEASTQRKALVWNPMSPRTCMQSHWKTASRSCQSPRSQRDPNQSSHEAHLPRQQNDEGGIKSKLEYNLMVNNTLFMF